MTSVYTQYTTNVTFRLAHLLGNVVFQMILGVLLEIVHGWKRIGIIYLASVLGGSMFITVLSPQTYAVGASAGVYGLLFAHLSTIIINWNEMDRKCCRVFWLLAYMTYDIGYSIYVDVVLNKDTNVTPLISKVKIVKLTFILLRQAMPVIWVVQ